MESGALREYSEKPFPRLKKVDAMKKKSFGQCLKENVEAEAIDFQVRARIEGERKVCFYIHPDSKDGETADFFIREDTLLDGESLVIPVNIEAEK